VQRDGDSVGKVYKLICTVGLLAVCRVVAINIRSLHCWLMARH